MRLNRVMLVAFTASFCIAISQHYLNSPGTQTSHLPNLLKPSRKINTTATAIIPEVAANGSVAITDSSVLQILSSNVTSFPKTQSNAADPNDINIDYKDTAILNSATNRLVLNDATTILNTSKELANKSLTASTSFDDDADCGRFLVPNRSTCNTTFAVQSSKIADALECWQSRAFWHDAYLTFAASHQTFSTFTELAESLISKRNPNATYAYTLCDGIPRIDAPQYIVHTTYKTTTVTDYTMTEIFPVPTPSCTIPSRSCDALANLSSSSRLSLPYQMQRFNPCDSLKGNCQAMAGGIRLLYWPAATVIGSLCDDACPNPYHNFTIRTDLGRTFSCPACSASRSVIMPSANGLVTTVLDGYTLTSPTVYCSISLMRTVTFVQTIDLHGNTSSPPVNFYYGPTITNKIVPMHSKDVSTRDLWPALNTNYHALDWADLNAPVPIQALNCTRDSDDQFTVYNDYPLLLSIPRQILTLVPAWSTCEPFVLGAFDPPHALQESTIAASPIDIFTTMPAASLDKTMAPSPGPTAALMAPTSTSSEQAQYSPTKHSPGQSNDLGPGGQDVNPHSASNFDNVQDTEAPSGDSNGAESNPSAASSTGRDDSRRPDNMPSESSSRSRTGTNDAGEEVGAVVASLKNGGPNPGSWEATTPNQNHRAAGQGRSLGDIIASAFGISEDSSTSVDPSPGTGENSQGAELAGDSGSQAEPDRLRFDLDFESTIYVGQHSGTVEKNDGQFFKTAGFNDVGTDSVDATFSSSESPFNSGNLITGPLKPEGNANEANPAADNIIYFLKSGSAAQEQSNGTPGNFFVDTREESAMSITIGNSILTLSREPIGQGIMLPHSETLYPGEVTTLDGTRFSLAAGSSAIVIGTETFGLPTLLAVSSTSDSGEDRDSSEEASTVAQTEPKLAEMTTAADQGPTSSGSSQGIVNSGSSTAGNGSPSSTPRQSGSVRNIWLGRLAARVSAGVAVLFPFLL